MKKFLIILLILFVFTGCNHSSIMKNSMINDSVECTESKIQVVASDKRLYEVDLQSFINPEDFDFISGYENQISIYSDEKNQISILNESGDTVDTQILSEYYSIRNFKQIGQNEYLLGVMKKVQEDASYSVIHVKDGEEHILYDDQLNNGVKLQMRTKGFTMVGDILYLIDFNNEVFEVRNNQLLSLAVQEECIDLIKVDNKLGILTLNSVIMIDVASDQVVEKINFESEKPLKVIYSKNSGFKILTDNAVYYQDKENEFIEVKIDNLQHMYMVEGLYISSSGQILVTDDSYKGYYDFVDETIVDKPDITIGIIANYYDISRAVKKLDYGDINVESFLYKDLINAFDYDMFIDKFSSDFLTKSAPDIIGFQRWAYIHDYFEQGHLVDLKPLMDGDPTFDKELYETNYFEACTINGKTPYIMIHPWPQYIEFNGELLNQLGITLPEELSMNDLYDIYVTANKDLSNPEYHIAYNKGDGNIVNTYQKMYEKYLFNDLKTFIDYETRTASFDSKEFVEFINKAKVLIEGGHNSPFTFRALAENYGKEEPSPLLDNHLFYIGISQNGFYYDLEIYKTDSIIKTMPKGFISNKAPIFVGTYLTINSDCKDINKAWEVMKKLISKESDYYASDPGRHGNKMAPYPFAILKESNEIKLKYVIDHEKDKEIKTTEGQFQTIQDLLKADYITIPKSSLDQSLSDDIERFITNEITAKELSIILQNKAELYLRE